MAFSVAPDPEPQNVLSALCVHAYGHEDVMLAEAQTVQVEDEEVDVVKAPLAKTPQLLLGRLDALPAHGRLRHPHRLGQLGKHGRVVPRRDPSHQQIQHPLPQPGVGLHGRVRRHLHLPAPAPAAKPGLSHLQLAPLEGDATPLAAVSADLATPLARMRLARQTLGREQKHSLHARPADDVHQVLHGQLGLLHQRDQGQKRLPLLGQKGGQPLGLFLVDDLVSFSHGGSSSLGLWPTRF